jgi:hypothetical protein
MAKMIYFLYSLILKNLKRFCVSFQTTPYGNQRDLQVFDGTFKDNDWDALWKVRTTITDSGYYAEFAIPFKSVRYENVNALDSVSWGITFARLAIINDLLGRKYTESVMLDLEYDPKPPYNAGVPSKTDPLVLDMLKEMYDMLMLPLIQGEQAKRKLK